MVEEAHHSLCIVIVLMLGGFTGVKSRGEGEGRGEARRGEERRGQTRKRRGYKFTCSTDSISYNNNCITLYYIL